MVRHGTVPMPARNIDATLDFYAFGLDDWAHLFQMKDSGKCSVEQMNKFMMQSPMFNHQFAQRTR